MSFFGKGLIDVFCSTLSLRNDDLASRPPLIDALAGSRRSGEASSAVRVPPQDKQV